ncbi:MAG: methylated-DNA--[protein]-cysteine S-methyltransferase [Caldilineaceae bacterium]|nr:methylated-DNA--[protein]-cysteine S-methyltransferase [Caldilineaceae bacterium]
MSDVLKPERSPRTSGVNFTTALCRYGAVLVAATDQGICDIHLSTNRDELIESYQRSAESTVSWVDGDEQPDWLTAVLNLAEDPTYAFDFPLDIKGTPFQKAVWQALCKVPAGQTTTYGALANAIGKPTASRAVGTACGANRLALAIPCHRALRKGSGPLDYRWEKEIKQEILAAEAAWVFEPR